MHRFPALLAALALLLAGPLPAAGAEIVATILGDTVDLDLTDGVCDTDPAADAPDPLNPGQFLGQCTLRAAVQTANVLAGPDRIRLRGNTYVLSLTGPGEDLAATGDLDITTDITIDGEGYQFSLLDGKRLKDRIFDVRPGGTLTLNKTGLLFGKTAKADFDPGRPGEVSGGCLRSAGISSLDEVFFFECKSNDDGGCMSVIDGTATVSATVFASCRAKNEGGCFELAAPGSATLSRVTGGACKASTGGGLASRGALSLRNATFTLNKASLGGGVAVLGDSSATITHSTFHLNGKTNLANQTSGTVTVSNTIVWGAKTDCVGNALSSAGGNLEGATSCGFVAASDQQNKDPLLQPLGIEGAIAVAPIAESSPAIDHGVDPVDVCEDPGDARQLQRKDSIVGGTLVDTGAYEFDAANPELLLSSVPVTSATVGVAYSYDVNATNPGRELCTLEFSLLPGAPVGMSIDSASGLITWTPTAEQEGDRTVTARLSEPDGLARFQTFTITVAPAP